ncbi:MAG: hypothetical protein ACYC8T_25720 [Myxococcaceae bacterium]
MNRKDLEDIIKRELGKGYSLRTPRVAGEAAAVDSSRKKKRRSVDAVAPSVSKPRGDGASSDARRGATAGRGKTGIAIVEVERKSTKDAPAKDRKTVVVSLRTGKVLGERG